MKKTAWFSSWFDTPYYHILYKDRNDDDAQLFMRNITQFLKLPKKTHIADLPCGKGRHSVYLNSLGYRVTGADLSENSIAYAKKFENETLNFVVKDMRNPFRKFYDAVFNLFTSFGYFESDKENILVLKNIKNGLTDKGVLVLDFLNPVYVEKNLVANEEKLVDGILFNIHREIKNGYILKHISFNNKNQSFHFTEKVQYIDYKKFKEYFTKVNFQLAHTFGDYQLSKFEEENSERLILVAR